MPMSRILEGLNEAQKSAVTTTEGPLLIVAGPGTGKTLTLVRRLVFLVEKGVRPDQILAVTFTNRTAREMGERMNGYAPDCAGRAFIGTFHLLGLRIMREHLQEDFVLCNREDQINLLKGLTGSSKKSEAAVERIGRIKNLLEEPDRDTMMLCEAYEAILKEKGLRDFDDLIRVPGVILEDEATAALYKERFKYIMVDEYQDINPLQYRLLRQLVDDKANICVVGDSDQAIYAFRGADVENFLSFEKDYPGAQRVVLRDNYRSSRTILDASSSLIGNNTRRIEKKLEAVRKGKGAMTVISVPDDRTEAEAVVAEIEAMMGGTSHYSLMKGKVARDLPEDSYSFRDFAVIFRTNGQAKIMEEVFLESGIPFQVVKPKSSAGIKEIAGLLTEIVNDDNDVEDATLTIRRLCERPTISEVDKAMITQVAMAYSKLSPGDALHAVLSELTLLTSGDGFDERAEAVTLTTLHGSKGLEFKTVFITGVEDGLIPFLNGEDETDVEEERRLFYVGMTRAKDELFLLRAKSRFIYGRRLAGKPSRFFDEIPDSLLHEKIVKEKPRNKKQRQMKLF